MLPTEAELVELTGDDAALVERLRVPLARVLAPRHAFYAVDVQSVGRVGEILVRVSGSKGRVPLLFGAEDVEEAGYVATVVGDTVARFGL